MRVLFVCSGNTCRSPMAEGYLSSKRLPGISVSSAGFISEGDAASENAVEVMREIGIDISSHTSHLLTGKLLEADRIYCMTEGHRYALIKAGITVDKISVLGGGIPDPYGQNENAYRDCRDRIIDAIDAALYGGEILPVKILQCDKGDATDIAALEKECFSSPWSENAVIEGMDHKTVFFKAVADGSFAGYIGVTAVAGEGYINNIAVKKEFRLRGIGSLLIDRAVTFALGDGLEFISLEVRASNAEAISVYENAGFIKAGNRKNFYENPKEDGVIMTRRFCIC